MAVVGDAVSPLVVMYLDSFESKGKGEGDGRGESDERGKGGAAV